MYPFEPYKIDTEFNKPASYGPHEGLDFNGVGGGNTDCGFEIRCVYPGTVILSSKSNANYGNMLVVECDTPRGKRWVRYCHLDERRITSGAVKRGEVLGTMGSTGNSTACHLHLDVLTKKPSNWRFYSKNVTAWFEDPEIIINDTIEDNMDYQWLEQMYIERGVDIRQGESHARGQVQTFFDKAKRYDDDVPVLKEQVKSANEALSEKTMEVSVLMEKNQKLSSESIEAREERDKARGERDKAYYEKKQAENKVGLLEREIKILKEENTRLKENNDLFAYSWIQRFVSLFKKAR